jgi:archaellin
MRSAGKRGIELAAGTMVTLLVAIIILSASMVLTYRVLCAAADYSADVDARTQSQIESLLGGRGEVVVAQNSHTARRAGNALCGTGGVESATFVLGVRNIFDGGYEFTVRVEGEAGAPGNIQIPTNSTLDGAVNGTYYLEAGERRTIPILIIHNGTSERGQHAYNIRVWVGDDFRGAQRIYLIIE